jgi:hypothetical protein
VSSLHQLPANLARLLWCCQRLLVGRMKEYVYFHWSEVRLLCPSFRRNKPRISLVAKTAGRVRVFVGMLRFIAFHCCSVKRVDNIHQERREKRRVSSYGYPEQTSEAVHFPVTGCTHRCPECRVHWLQHRCSCHNRHHRRASVVCALCIVTPAFTAVVPFRVCVSRVTFGRRFAWRA